MSAASSAPGLSNRRRIPRSRIEVPVDITILRSGVPESIPGRTVNFCDDGLAAFLAGEVRQGDTVGVTLQLEGAIEPLHAKAIVRHYERLCCGLEFQSLSLDQQEIIHTWHQTLEPVPHPIQPIRQRAAVPNESMKQDTKRSRTSLRWVLWAALVLLVLIVFAAGWKWQREWQELESPLMKQQSLLTSPTKSESTALTASQSWSSLEPNLHYLEVNLCLRKVCRTTALLTAKLPIAPRAAICVRLELR